MTILDISRRIGPDVAVYPGDEQASLEPVCDIGDDAPCRITSLGGFTTHLMTHVDAPRHFIAGGKTLDEIPVERWVTDALVVDIQDAAYVSRAHVPEGDLTGLAILFKTRNSLADPTAFDENHAYVSAEAAQEMISRSVNIIGIDYHSVDRFGDEDFPVHKSSLGADVLIVEGLDLTEVKAGRYRLIALPLKIAQADGSPVRAVLIRD